MKPTISFTAKPKTLIEDEGTKTTFTFKVKKGKLPQGGLDVSFKGDPFSLGDFDLLPLSKIKFKNMSLVQGFPDNDGATLNLTKKKGSIKFAVFDDQDRPNPDPPDDPRQDPLRNDDIGLEKSTFTLLGSPDYKVDKKKKKVKLTIVDTASQLPSSDSDADTLDIEALSSGDDLLFGDDDDNLIKGGKGNDSIFAGLGDDTVKGNRGDDLLSGDGGNDKIRGGKGDDLLMGVTGDDTLSGGAGSDTFIFGNGDGTDHIRDFDPEIDKIGLVEGELVFEDLAISQVDDNVSLSVIGTGETLAIIKDIDADTLTPDSFVIVEDVSAPPSDI